jgi:glycine dehydrogenase subunit 2
MADQLKTITGNRGLQIEELLIFEQSRDGRLGVDLPEPAKVKTRLGGLERKKPLGLPNLSPASARRIIALIAAFIHWVHAP